jgi:hypothetical protein
MDGRFAKHCVRSSIEKREMVKMVAEHLNRFATNNTFRFITAGFKVVL